MRSIGDAQLAVRMVRSGLLCLVVLFFALPAASAVADPDVTAAPSALNFGSRELDAGPSSTLTSTVTNTGTLPVSVNSVSIGGDQRSQFTLVTGAGDDCGANNPIAANESC